MPVVRVARKASLSRAAPWIALALGMLLAALTGIGGVPAALGALLAQPALALAVSWQRQTRVRPSGFA